MGGMVQFVIVQSTDGKIPECLRRKPNRKQVDGGDGKEVERVELQDTDPSRTSISNEQHSIVVKSDGISSRASVELRKRSNSLSNENEMNGVSKHQDEKREP